MSQRSSNNTESGTASLAVILVIVLALIGGAGYMVWKQKSNTNKSKQAESSQQQQAKAKAVEAAQKAAEDKRIADAKAKLQLAAKPFASQYFDDVYYPEGWKIEEPEVVDGIFLSITSPTAGKDAHGKEFAPSVLLGLGPIYFEPKNIEGLKIMDSESYADYKVMTQRTAKAADGTQLDVVEATYTNDDGIRVYSLSALAVQETGGILFSATSLERDWPIYQDIFEQVLTK